MHIEISTAGMARAAALVGRINLKIIKHAAARRQGHVSRTRAPEGDRAPASLARRPVALRELTERRPNGKAERITPLGYRTAVVTLPRMLAKLDEADPRRRAAILFADTAERIGSIKGADLSSGDGFAGQSDGGATTRVKHAARLRLIEALANGWDVSSSGRIQRGPERAILSPAYKSAKRQEIKAYEALTLICVEGLDVKAVLRQSGWGGRSEYIKDLTSALLDVLDDVAAGLGLGRWNAKRA